MNKSMILIIFTVVTILTIATISFILAPDHLPVQGAIENQIDAKELMGPVQKAPDSKPLIAPDINPKKGQWVHGFCDALMLVQVQNAANDRKENLEYSTNFSVKTDKNNFTVNCKTSNLIIKK